MKPFFSYIGSKWTLAPRYGTPQHSTVIEPFAGSAAYSVRHNVTHAILIDRFPKIIELWNWLIAATPDDVQSLPIDFERVSDLDLPDGAKWLIGFWISKGDAEPKNTRSAWARQYRHAPSCKVWNEAVRSRIATQVELIKNWEARCIDFTDAPDMEATWFIDPPYQLRGHACYSHWKLDYDEVARFAQSRRGQIIVCEGSDADYGQFKQLTVQRGTFGKGRSGRSPEFVWYP